MCYAFYGEDFEFIIPYMKRCCTQYIDNCMIEKGVTSLYDIAIRSNSFSEKNTPH